MGKPKRTGRPKGSTYALTMMYFHVARYKQIKLPKTKHGQVKSKLTSWNAWNKFTESKHFPPLVRHYYKRHKYKEYNIGKMLDDSAEGKAVRNKFFINNLKRRGKDLLVNYLFTKPKEYTHRKKR